MVDFVKLTAHSKLRSEIQQKNPLLHDALDKLDTAMHTIVMAWHGNQDKRFFSDIHMELKVAMEQIESSFEDQVDE